METRGVVFIQGDSEPESLHQLEGRLGHNTPGPAMGDLVISTWRPTSGQWTRRA
jgi:hypothetical protein